MPLVRGGAGVAAVGAGSDAVVHVRGGCVMDDLMCKAAVKYLSSTERSRQESGQEAPAMFPIGPVLSRASSGEDGLIQSLTTMVNILPALIGIEDAQEEFAFEVGEVASVDSDLTRRAPPAELTFLSLEHFGSRQDQVAQVC